MVTGGAGFIGSNFIRYWLNKYKGDSILNVDVLTYAGNLENLKEIEKDARYSFSKTDICDKEKITELVKDCDIIVHFAAESHVDRSILGPGEFVRTNILGTQVLLDAIRTHGKRIHHVSTDEVFGSLGPNDVPFNENTTYNPRSPYSASKASSDYLVRAYFHTYGVQMTISNCSNNYGPYQFPEKIIPLFISNLSEGKKVPVYGDGMQIRDWIFVDDHSRGVDAIIQKGRIGETYCLGGGNQIANIDLTKKLLNLLGKSEDMIEFVKDRPGHDRRYDIDFSKATKELDWNPAVDFDSGLKATVDWYLNNKKWVEDCKSGAYKEYYEKWYGRT
jgi:dTDP-glucose 4,6-dehydratase